MKLVSIAILFLFFCLNCLGQTQNIRFDRLTEKEGLPTNSVNDIEVDHQGFLWFATWSGLGVYDGNEVKTFSYSTDAQSSISSAQVDHLYVRNRNEIMVGATNYVDYFNRKTERFRNTKINERSIDFLEDSRGNLWIATYSHLWVQYAGDTTLTMIERVGENSATALFEDKEGDIWIGMFFALLQYNPDKEEYTFHDLKRGVTSVTQDNDGYIWVGTYDGLLKIDKSDNTKTWYFKELGNPLSVSSNTITSLWIDKKDRFWVGTEEGLNLFEKRSGEFRRYYNNPEDRFSLSSNHVTDICEDLEGNIWIATRGGGVNMIRGHQNPFHTFRLNEGELRGTGVSQFFERPNGDIWIGTVGGGLHLFRKKENSIKRYLPINEQNAVVYALIEDSGGIIWVNTTQGTYRVKVTEEQFIKERIEKHPNITWSIIEDSRMNVWVVGIGDIYRYDLANNEIMSYQNNNANHVYEDRFGNVWFGRDDGIFIYDHELDSLIPKISGSGFVAVEDFIDNKIFVVKWDGIYECDIDSLELRMFLPPEEIAPFGGCLDDIGGFWIITQNGLYRYDIETGIKQRYDESDGLQGNEYQMRSYLKTSSGEFYFGGNQGFTYFHPDSIKSNPYIPPVYITEFLLLNEPVTANQVIGNSEEPILNKSILFTDEIVLPYSQNMFSLEFAALNYINPKKNRYRYKLEGFNKDWVETDAGNRVATYTNLNPGNYTFNVTGSNNDGIWNEDGRSINITVLPPWWLTWWAKSGYIMMFIGGVWGIIYSRTLKHKRKIKAIEEVNKATGKFVPYKFIKYLGKESILDVKAGDQTLQEVSVLFCDIRDYTSISEEMSPEDNFKFINSFVKRMVPIIEKNEGFVNQFMGDGIMTIFPKDSTHALQSAVEMQRSIERYNHEREAKGRAPIKVGIGIHTGPLIMGIIGNESRSDPSTISDTVNAASRMEGMTKFYGARILLSEQSFQVASDKDLFNFRYLGEVLMKGKNIPLKVYECFDSDSSETIKLKKATASHFEEGLNLYYAKEFAESKKCFEKILDINPRDLTAKYFFVLASNNATNGVEEDWSGVERLELK